MVMVEREHEKLKLQEQITLITKYLDIHLNTETNKFESWKDF